MFYCCAITDKGIRDNNEDAYIIGQCVQTEGAAEFTLKPPFLAAVADGVSGEQCGELASSFCLNQLSEINYSEKTDLHDTLMQIHESMTQYSIQQAETFNMQTTLCGIGLDENERLCTFNVGDSRLYRYRAGRLVQLSRDQSLVQMLYEEGTITMEEKRHHRQRNIIFPVLGNCSSKPVLDIHTRNDTIAYGDIFLLCSDGLSDYASTSEMEEILALPKPLIRRLRLLADCALQNNGSDNITIVAITRTT